jgi:indole-3-glycerol phosphate synthase
MDVLYEAHEPANVRRAATLAEREPEHVLVGVNNRDLRTFTTDLDVTLRALRELPKGLLVVAESGIAAAADVRRLRDAGAAGVLVGEHLMRQADVGTACQALMAEVRA